MKKLLIFLIFIFISSCGAGEEFIPVDYRVRPETWKKNVRHFSVENTTNS